MSRINLKDKFYNINAKLTTKAIKKVEKITKEMLEKEFEWSYNYLMLKYYGCSYTQFRVAFKSKFKTKNISSGSVLDKMLLSQYQASENLTKACSYLEYCEQVKVQSQINK